MTMSPEGPRAVEDLAVRIKPHRGNRFVVWSLRIGLFLVVNILQGIGLIRDWLKFRLALIQWYRPRPDDIFIVSYPKSGTTLMQMICYQLKTDGSIDIPHIGYISPWFESELVRTFPQIIEATTSPRIFKSHLRYGEKLPRGVRYIYLVRNPGDVAVSSYHHHCMTAGVLYSRERYLQQFFSDQSPFGSWFKHVASWWPHRHDENVLFLRYEDVIGDLQAAVRKVALFCDFPLDETQMPRILERCSLAFMKQHGDKFDPRIRRFSSRLAEFIREGRAGTGAEALGAEQKKRLERKVDELVRDLGCSAGDADYLYGRDRAL
jgi:hypothetical protein